MKLLVIGHVSTGFRFYGPIPDSFAINDEIDEPTHLLEPGDEWFLAELETPNWREMFKNDKSYERICGAQKTSSNGS